MKKQVATTLLVALMVVTSVSVTWDDTLADGTLLGQTQTDKINEMIAAIKRRGSSYVVSRDVYGDYYADGTADDVQIQAAIDAATAAGGGVVLIKEGSYDIASTINMKSNVILMGEGKGSILNNSQSGDDLSLLSANDVTHWTIRDLSFTGDGAAGDAITIQGTCTNFQVIHNYIGHGSAPPGEEGIIVEGDASAGSFNGIIAYNDIREVGARESSPGIQIGSALGANQPWNIIVTGNIIYNLGNNYNAIYVYGGEWITVTNNLIRGCRRGVVVDNGADTVIIANNIIKYSYIEGIFIDDTGAICVRIQIKDNDVEDSGQSGAGSGIKLDGIDGCVISGNTVTESNDHGIELDAGSDANLVTGNYLKDNGAYGIQLTATSDYNRINDNYTEGNTSGSINVAANTCDNNTVSLNTVEEGAPADAGTNTRSYGNYDPSANAFVGDVGAAPW